MSKLGLNFKGLMAPVFTLFNDDETQSLNLAGIDDYARILKAKGIKGVLVNGTSGEGPVLNINERKTLCEQWKNACEKHSLVLMVQIGGAPVCDVVQLAQHAQQMEVDAVLCLTELYFKPNSIQSLVGYLKHIAKYCSQIPFLYYHIPMFTGLNFHMPTFCDLAENEISNFVGLKYTSGDLELGSGCLKKGRNVFLGADTILTGAIALGFDSAIMTTLNIFPELAQKIIDCMQDGKLTEARTTQIELSKRVQDILKNGGGEWVPSMKKEFNASWLNAGPVRKVSF